MNQPRPASSSDVHETDRSPATGLTHLSLQLLWHANEAGDTKSFAQAATTAVREHFQAAVVAIVVPHQGQWTTLARSGNRAMLPEPLMADALDRLAIVRQSDGWIAVPLRQRIETDHLLVMQADLPGGALCDESLVELADTLGSALASIRGRRRRNRRIQRLEAILEIATQWYRARDMQSLLVRIAEAATRLLHADRASIFLWDKANHILVGRPALGIDGDELKIADDAGVVGHVIHTGQSRRIDRHQGQDQIDRHVDEQLGYHTETLLCVPLRSPDGKIIGAFEVINKHEGDFDSEDEEALLDLAAHAAIALENTREREQLIRARDQITAEAAQGVQLIGTSPAIEALRSTIRRVADTDLAVLITGENGTGKEVAARLIHYLGRRREQPFIAVNCAAIAETLLESELFGHERGAFTDAGQSRPGKFELASGGTLFLDEIGDLSLSGQAKLLRVLEEKVVTRVGGTEPIHIDTRVLAATNQDLARMVREKKFREDLFYRLNVVNLHLPPLRERPDDILLLVEHFLDQFCRQARRPRPKLTRAARQRLLQHPWPGNVRELRNLIERLAYLTPDDTIDADELGLILAPASGAPDAVAADLPLNRATAQFQRQYIEQAIARARGNMSLAAKRLGLHRSNLYRKMRGLGISTAPPTSADSDDS